MDDTPDTFERDFADSLNACGLTLPTDAKARAQVVAAARQDPDLLDADELGRRHTELWGFREAARYLGMSWKLVRKFAQVGLIPTLPKKEWTTGPVTVYRRHFRRTPFGPAYTHTTEEVRIVDLLFDPKQVKKLDPEKLRELSRQRRYRKKLEALGR